MPTPAAKPATSQRQRISGRMAAAIALILSMVATLALAQWTHQREHAHLEAVFRLAASERIGAIRRELDAVLECVRSLQTFYTASDSIERSEFSTFTSAIIERHQSIPALFWLPRVPGIQRELYEADAREHGASSFFICEFGPAGEKIPAAKRDEHFPVWFGEPPAALAYQLGFDFAVAADRTSAMWRAIDTGRPAVTIPVPLPARDKAQRGVLLFAPVYAPVNINAPREPRAVRGVVLGMICVSELATDALRVFSGPPFDVRIADDMGVPAGNSPLLSGAAPDAGDSRNLPLSHSEQVTIYGRRWLVTLSAPPGAAFHDHNTAPLITLIAGSVLSILLAGFVWAFMDRARARELAVERADAAAEARRTLEQAQAVGRIGSWISGSDRAGWLEWSPEVYRIFGVDQSAFDGRVETFFSMVHPDDREAVQAAATAALHEGAVYSIDHRIIRRDGSVRWVHEQAEIEKDAQGRPRMVGVVQDITDRKLAEEAHRQGEEQLRRVFDALVDPVWDWDVVADRTDFSPSWDALLGFEPGQIAREKLAWNDLVHPDDGGAVWALLRGCIEGRSERYEAEYRLKTRAGDYKWVLSRGRVVERGEGGRATRLVGSITDISARRRAEEALRASEERYRAFVAHSSEAIWRYELTPPIPVDATEDEFLRMASERARLAECNEVVARMYGASSPEELIGKPLAELLVFSDPHNLEFLRAFHASGFRLADAETHEVDLDGNAKYFTNNLVGIVSDGLLTRVWGTQRDITERHAAEQLRSGQNRVLEMLAAGEPLATVLAELVRVIESQLSGAIGSVLLLDDDGLHMRTAAAPNLPEAYSQMVDGQPIGPRAGSCGTAMHDRRRVIVEDVTTDPLWEGIRAGPLAHGLRACWSEPIVGSRGRILGSFAMYYRTPRRPTERETAVITSAAHLAGVCIERRLDEERIRSSEANLRALLSAIPDMMFRMDRDGRYLDCHAPNPDDLYAQPEKFLGRNVREIFPPEHAERRLDNLQRAIDTGIPQTYEYRVESGRRRFWEVRVARCAEDQALLLVRDVTERRLDERRLQDSEQRLSMLVQQSPVGVIIWNTDFVIAEWNRAAEHIFGFSAQEAIGRTAELIVPENVRPHVRKVWESLLARQGGTRSTNQNLTRDGRLIFCDWYNAALSGPDGRIVAIASIVDDVTEQRTAQRRQELLMAELDHRVKNNLAAVLSLAEHTGRNTPTFAEFRRSFSSRVRAMARTHGLLARSSWTGAELGALVRQTLEAFHDPQPRVSIDGPEVVLPPRAAQSLAMALNELATNAAKYGALSTSSGHVDIRWRRSDAAATPPNELVLNWIERGGPALPSQPVRRGFGTELIEGAIRYELQGSVEITFAPAGLECTFRLPQHALAPEHESTPLPFNGAASAFAANGERDGDTPV